MLPGTSGAPARRAAHDLLDSGRAMAHVVLLSATPADDQTPDHLAPLHDMQKRAACDRRGVHRLTSSPEEADVILFVESYGAGWHFERVRRHPSRVAIARSAFSSARILTSFRSCPASTRPAIRDGRRGARFPVSISERRRTSLPPSLPRWPISRTSTVSWARWRTRPCVVIWRR